jgi:lipopolysaccharide export system ATP-binding protein
MSKLETREISKSYRGRKVVDDVTVSVDQGEVVGLLGPNGAGKTTSFYMIVGLMTPDSGRVTLDEDDITTLAMYQRARKGISYLPQEASVFRKLSVEDNLTAILQTLRLTRRERRETALDRLIAQLGSGAGAEAARATCSRAASGGAWRSRARLVIEPKLPAAGRAVLRASIRFRCWSCSASSSI